MTLYEQVHEQLFENGSCEVNTWYPIHIELEGKETDAEAAYPNRGEIRVRKLIKNNIYMRFRFNKKHELVCEGNFEFTDNVPWHGVEVLFYHGHKLYA